LKNWDNAVSDFRSAIKHSPNNVADYAGLAEVLMGLGQYDESVETYATAIRLISDQIKSVSSDSVKEEMSRNAMTYFENIAAIRIKQGQNEDALTNLGAAHTISLALGDTEYADKLTVLMNGINK